MMRLRAGFLILAALLAAACTTVDLKTSSRLTPAVSGWFDAGVTPDGKNKLVPSISFTLTNTGQTTWGTMEINCVFRRVGDPEEWSTVLLMGARAGLNGLAPGATSPPIVVHASTGYTGTEPRAELLQNKLFVDAKVEIFGKPGGARWVKLGEYPIARQLLTR
jgi:hypothetical protein